MAQIATSPDGITWTQRRSGSDDAIVLTLTWSPDLGLFVAGGYIAAGAGGSWLATSPDGVHWTQRSVPLNFISFSVWSSDLGLFVVGAGSGDHIATSPNGVTWTQRLLPAPAGGVSRIPSCAAWSPSLGLFFIGNFGQSSFWTSPDGVNWTAGFFSVGASFAGSDVAWSEPLGLLVYTNGGGHLVTSPNASTWTLYKSSGVRLSGFGSNDVIACALWADGLNRFVLTGGAGGPAKVVTSPNGTTWSQVGSVGNEYLRTLAWSEPLGLLVAAGGSFSVGVLKTSPNGVTWTSRTIGIEAILASAWSDARGIFVVGSGGIDLPPPPLVAGWLVGSVAI